MQLNGLAVLRRGDAVRALLVALVVVGAGVELILGQHAIRSVEASVAAALAATLGVVPAHSLGTAVVFPLDQRFVGFSLTAGCTASLLAAPFCLIAAGLVATRRISVARGLFTLGLVSAVLFAVNQLRLLVIAASMRLWGFTTGYNRSHVLLGSLVSSIGLVIGLLLFVLAMVYERRAQERHG
jgi:hypothetical protein